MRMLLLAVAIIAATMAPRLAWAQTHGENWTRCKDNDAEPDLRISACTAIIQSGQETAENLAAAFIGRCAGRYDKREYDAAIEDCDEALKLDPSNAGAFIERGLAFYGKGQLDRAIQDYDQAISLDPKSVSAFHNRANAYYSKGQYDRAIQDYDQAIGLYPTLARSINGRGFADFSAGRFGAAARDFAQSLAYTQPRGVLPYVVLWLHLARARDGQEDTQEFMRNAARLDLRAWPGPVVASYLKQMTAQQVMEAAQSGDETMQQERGCEASFYLGEDAVLRHKTAEALRLLRQAHETCPVRFVEYEAAAAELKRLGE